MHSLLHDIPRFLILLLEDLFIIFNRMLSIRAFGRHESISYHNYFTYMISSAYIVKMFAKPCTRYVLVFYIWIMLKHLDD